MTIINSRETIKELTYKMSRKERFAFVNFSRSALLTATGKIPAEKRPPKPFVKSIVSALEIKNSNYMKAIPTHMIGQGSGFSVSEIKSLDNEKIYDAGMLEYYYVSKKDIFDSFVEHYIKYSSTLVVSFHEKKTIQKVIGSPKHYLQVPYNDFYDKLDSIYESIIAHENIDYCILDCPVLASALAPKIWENSNMSILDFGKVFTIASK
jgi:hypothetical protein